MPQSTVRSPGPGTASAPGAGRHDLLDCLAAQAVRRVAERVRGAHDDPDASAQERLHAAAVGRDRRPCGEVARALLAEGQTVERLCDIHIPEVARRLGEEWVADELSFATVTIGAARLQALLRELDLGLVGRTEGADGAVGAILLVVAPGADHTLGPLLLASQLRRRGLAVRLSMGEPPEAVAAAAAGARFDGVFLSATVAASLPHLGRTAQAIRGATRLAGPLLLGGAAVAAGAATLAGREPGGAPGVWRGASPSAGEPEEAADLAAIDHVTCDLDEAMRLCGVGVAKKLDRRRTFSGP